MKFRHSRLLCGAAVTFCLIAGIVGLVTLQNQTLVANQSKVATSAWTARDIVQYVGWKLRFRDSPPDIYIDWIAQQVKSESTILTESEQEK
jgi:hypothetical protein